MANPGLLSEQEAAVYDRQLRVWGVETQKRLSSSKILILGCTGLAAEVAKNVVLAGVGSVTLVDDTPAAAAPPSNFLVHAGAAATVAEACAATLAEMNPFVQLATLPGPVAGALAPDRLSQFDLVLLTGQPAWVVDRADVLCRAAGVPFYAAACRGISGWAFADLGQHEYVVESKKEQPDGSVAKSAAQHSASYPAWEATMGCSLKDRSFRRANMLYLVLRVCAQFEGEHGRAVAAGDLPALREAAQQLCKAQGVGPTLLDDRLLEAYARCPEEMPPVSAVVGGILANDLLKAVARKGEPLRNLFMYSLTDGVGSVEAYGC